LRTEEFRENVLLGAAFHLANLGQCHHRHAEKLASPLYAAEWSYTDPGGIAIVDVTVKGGPCTLTETEDSPVAESGH